MKLLVEEIIKNDNFVEFQVLTGKSTFNQNNKRIRREPYFYRHLIHKKIISRIFQRSSSKKIRAAIHDMIRKLGFNPENSYKIIDVSCGYDDLLIELAQKFKNSEVIGNDICDKQLLSFPRKTEINNITLTKRNLLSHEFCENENYDLIICKNTLHHLSRSDQLSVLKKLVKAGKNVIIVEIENPLKYSFCSFIWNFYYRKFLKDDGSNFLFRNEFVQINEPREQYLKKKVSEEYYCLYEFLKANEVNNDVILKFTGVHCHKFAIKRALDLTNDYLIIIHCKNQDFSPILERLTLKELNKNFPFETNIEMHIIFIKEELDNKLLEGF